jgi:hypothetical protein
LLGRISDFAHVERIQAHVLVCFLSLAMWRVLELLMCAKGLGS